VRHLTLAQKLASGALVLGILALVALSVVSIMDGSVNLLALVPVILIVLGAGGRLRTSPPPARSTSLDRRSRSGRKRA